MTKQCPLHIMKFWCWILLSILPFIFVLWQSLSGCTWPKIPSHLLVTSAKWPSITPIWLGTLYFFLKRSSFWRFAFSYTVCFCLSPMFICRWLALAYHDPWYSSFTAYTALTGMHLFLWILSACPGSQRPRLQHNSGHLLPRFLLWFWNLCLYW